MKIIFIVQRNSSTQCDYAMRLCGLLCRKRTIGSPTVRHSSQQAASMWNSQAAQAAVWWSRLASLQIGCMRTQGHWPEVIISGLEPSRVCKPKTGPAGASPFQQGSRMHGLSHPIKPIHPSKSARRPDTIETMYQVQGLLWG